MERRASRNGARVSRRMLRCDSWSRPWRLHGSRRWRSLW